MRDCPACRHRIDEDAAFCPLCGQSVQAMEARARASGVRARRRWILIFAGAGLLLVLASRWLPDFAPGQDPAGEPDLRVARAALTAEDWGSAIRLLSPRGAVPAGSEARRLLAAALHGRCLEGGGVDFDRAARVRELSLAEDPRDLAGLRARAELESSFGEPGRAAFLWWAALRAAEGHADRDDLLVDTAVARAVAGEFGRAELLLEQLLREQPAHARALSNRGLLHLRAGRLQLAAADLNSALTVEAGLCQARAGLVEAIRRTEGEEAAREAAARVELSESDCDMAREVETLISLG